jgi:hypothetical protein
MMSCKTPPAAQEVTITSGAGEFPMNSRIVIGKGKTVADVGTGAVTAPVTFTITRKTGMTMQQLPSKLHQPGLVLLIGLAGGLVPGVSQASASVETNLTANIVNATCQVSVENNGEIYLPTIMRGWFYNSDNSNRLTPSDDEQERLSPSRWLTVMKVKRAVLALNSCSSASRRKMDSGATSIRCLKTMPLLAPLKMWVLSFSHRRVEQTY